LARTSTYDVDGEQAPAELGGIVELSSALAVLPDEESIRFRDDTVRLTVTGLLDDHDGPKSVLVHLVAGRNVVVSLHDGPVRGLADPIEAIAGDPRFGRLSGGVFAGLLLEGILRRGGRHGPAGDGDPYPCPYPRLALTGLRRASRHAEGASGREEQRHTYIHGPRGSGNGPKARVTVSQAAPCAGGGGLLMVTGSRTPTSPSRRRTHPR
jgi:hypothetical protein